MRVDLDRRRDASSIIETAFKTWWAHLGIFVALAALPVIPVWFLVDGLWAGHLADPDQTGSIASQVGSTVIFGLVITPLVTAMHVLVVLGLARGEDPDAGHAIREGLRVLPLVAAAVLLYTLAVIVGLVLLIVPGIWLSVRLYFTSQAAVVDRVSPVAALKASAAAVEGSWWRTLGILILLGIVAALLALPLGFVTQIIGAVADNGPLYVLGGAIAQTVTLSFTALAGTLLFFDLRARKALASRPVAEPAPATGPDPGLAAPERP